MKLHDTLIKFIPKRYKTKYQNRTCNRKHASGYWFDFLRPKILSHSNGILLYRFLNFYFPVRCKHKKGYYEGNFEYGGYNIPSDCLCEYDIFCSTCHKLIGHYAYGSVMMFHDDPKYPTCSITTIDETIVHKNIKGGKNNDKQNNFLHKN